MHFKELFLIDGRSSDLSENDIARRNTIAVLLEDWDLLKIKNKEQFCSSVVDLSQIKILAHKEKSDWKLEAKYQIGGRKFNN